MAEETPANKGKYLYNKVVERLLEKIRGGEFEPGGKLPPERALADAFRVSRNCIRQAIQALAERKVLESRRGDGTYVRAVDESALVESFALAIRAKKELLREILEFRLLMEPLIASLAARNISREELDRLKVIVCDQERRLLAGSEDSELDAAFHLGLASASKNRIVKQVMDTVNGILNESRAESLRNETRRKASVVGHLKVIDALEERDSDRAFGAMREHLASIEKIVLGEDESGGVEKGGNIARGRAQRRTLERNGK